MERLFLKWLQSHIGVSEEVVLGPTDDAALVDFESGEHAVLSTDMLMDGVDFVCSDHDLALVGRKCMAVNLSDIAAMGAKPKYALVSLSIPYSWSAADTQKLMEGILGIARNYGAHVVGGDTNRWKHPLAVSITAIGTVAVGEAWCRQGARVGDRLVVTGPCGGSILGKHLEFSPRIPEADWLSQKTGVHAAIDVSDGLAWDTFQLATASGVGVVLNQEDIPITPAARDLARESEKTPLHHALNDGEDFEIVMAINPKSFLSISRDWPFEQPLIDFGEVVENPGFWIRQTDGSLVNCDPGGYEH